jgi:flavin reductase (DIM6/NTAB) family NADH-FMN oxidoreductase RutF
VRDNTVKHTYENLLEIPEVAINMVSYEMVQQVSLSSTDYPKGVNEFRKAGFTELASEIIRPPRVAESPVQFECVVNDIIPLGAGPGAGNIVIAEVKRMHFREDLTGKNGMIDQAKLDLVARLGGDWYCRITPDSLFTVTKPLKHLGIGVDALPSAIRHSKTLSGNDLGKLGNVESLPAEEEIVLMSRDPEVKDILDTTIGDPATRTLQLHIFAKKLLDKNLITEAWAVLLLD